MISWNLRGREIPRHSARRVRDQERQEMRRVGECHVPDTDVRVIAACQEKIIA